MELIILGSFCVLILLSVITHISILYALFAGLIMFLAYAAIRGHKPEGMLKMVIKGVKKAKNILTTFIFIGCMTALWRAAGTIPAIVSFSMKLINPKIVVICTFLLNCLVSFLIGTSFGTGATIGVITASVSGAMGITPMITGGAILSGALFGDRCSPVSTSMLLCADLTKTDPYRNIRTMFRTAAVPFILTCLIYIVLGLSSSPAGNIPDIGAVFGNTFIISPVVLAPAAVILLLAILHVSVKKAMLTSIIVCIPICIFIQHQTPGELLKMIIIGYHSSDSELASLIDGGGLISMLRCGCIVALSSAYSGIFEDTGLLNNIQSYILSIAEKTNAYTATLLTAILTSLTSCNQSLAIMLTHQLSDCICSDKYMLASWLEDTVVLIAPLVPWSIAGSTILYSSGLDLSGILFAFYLYLVPLWSLAASYIWKKS